jgi:hypothetical protein
MCIKVGYDKLRLAQEAKNHFNTLIFKGRKPQYVYHCNKCYQYHLTSMLAREAYMNELRYMSEWG